MKDSKYKFWELGLIFFGTFLFVASVLIYAKEIPLRKYFFGIEVNSEAEKVGLLGKKNGKVRRKIRQELDFGSINKSQDVYNHDTIVTQEGGAATILLEDGSEIELGESTMVVLAFESKLTLAGISRATAVNVVTGKVTGRAKENKIVLRSAGQELEIKKAEPRKILNVAKPVPSTPKPSVAKASPKPIVAATPTPKPAPVKSAASARLILPAENHILKASFVGGKPKATVKFSWQVKPPGLNLLLTVREATKRSELKNPPIFEKIVEDFNGIATAVVTCQKPGEYEWEITPEKNSNIDMPEFKHHFSVDNSIEGIRLKPPTVGGKPIDSSKYQGEALKKFDITIHWHALPNVDQYTVKLFRQEGASKPVFERTTSDTKYTLNRDKVFTGKIFYQVSASGPNGFEITSKLDPFRFDFLPPSLVLPKPNEIISLKGASKAKVLFTWRKTNFTEFYLLEVSKDESFKTGVINKKSTDNFLMVTGLSAGKYFWRVKSSSRGVFSPSSQAQKLEILATNNKTNP